MTRKLEQALRRSLEKSLSGNSWDKSAFWKLFRRLWIYAPSPSLTLEPPKTGAFYFLFWKNASVTNLQFVELNELIHRFVTRSNKSKDACPLIITNTPFYKKQIEDIFLSFTQHQSIDGLSESEVDAKISEIAEDILNNHGALIEHTVILDAFFNSAVLYLPATLGIELYSVVANSGYIHSAGSSIYIRDLTKTKFGDIAQNIRDNIGKGQRAFVTPYADEYFVPTESGAHSLRNGLSGATLQAKKHHIQNTPLESALESISRRVNTAETSRINLAHGMMPFREERELSKRVHACAEEFTIWLITDRELYFNEKDHLGYPAKKHYLIVYKQYVYNANPLMLFKERKPAWVQSVTLPHTLSRSVLAASSQASLSTSKQIRVLDPFVGSGTTLMDVMLLWPNAKFVGLDGDPFVTRMIDDNVAFFAQSQPELQSFEASLQVLANQAKLHQFDLRDALADEAEKNSEGIEAIVHRSLATLTSLNEKGSSAVGEGGELPKKLLSELGEVPLRERLIYHIVWRALKLNEYLYEKNGDRAIGALLFKEFEKAAKEVKHLIEDRGHEIIHLGETFDVSRGLYSNNVTHSRQRFLSLKEKITARNDVRVDIVDNSITHLATEMPTDEIFDLIVTDPPYGFNADESVHSQMRDLYATLFGLCIKRLAPGGELLICLPASARTGKDVPFYSTRKYVVSQLIFEAEAAKRQFIWKVRSQVQQRPLVDPPYYWGGTAAISRDILHFKLV